jgi:hypothetical protein
VAGSERLRPGVGTSEPVGVIGENRTGRNMGSRISPPLSMRPPEEAKGRNYANEVVAPLTGTFSEGGTLLRQVKFVDDLTLQKMGEASDPRGCRGEEARPRCFRSCPS